MNVGTERFRPTQSAEIVPLNNAWIVTNVTVGTSQAALVTALAQRRLIVIRNLNPTSTIYVGPDDGVTVSGSTRGWLIGPDEERSFVFGPFMAMHAIGDVASMDVQVLEAA